MSKLSRYIIKEFLSFLFYCILAFIVIFVLVDLVDNLDKFIDDKVRISLIFLYYLLYLPYITLLTLPVAMLLATLFSLGRLSGDNEITAMKASGISLYRILMPLYVLTFAMGIFIMAFTEFVVPRANLFRQDIKDQKNEFRFRFSISREMDRNDIFLANGDGRVIYARGYTTRNQTARNIVIIEPHENSGIKSRIDARHMSYSEGIWHLHGVDKRTFNGNEEIFEQHQDMDAPFILRKPSDFARIDIEPEEMNYFQLRKYLDEESEKGEDASEWLVDLYLKISFPFVSFVIVFFGAPLAAVSSKRGKAASFGIALVISFVFYALINACQVFGRNGTLHPVTAAWFPNGLFFLIGLTLLIKAKK